MKVRMPPAGPPRRLVVAPNEVEAEPGPQFLPGPPLLHVSPRIPDGLAHELEAVGRVVRDGAGAEVDFPTGFVDAIHERLQVGGAFARDLRAAQDASGAAAGAQSAEGGVLADNPDDAQGS